MGSNKIGISGLVTLLKSLRFSLVNHLDISDQKGLDPEVETMIEEFNNTFNAYMPRLVCLASVRTISRTGSNSHVRMLSSDILIRVAQTLGWFIDLKETIRLLEEHAD